MKKILFAFGLVASVSMQAQHHEGMVGQCPYHPSATPQKTEVIGRGQNNRDWWPNALNLEVLRQHSELSNPMDAQFSYEKAFTTLDYFALKKDINAVLTNSQDWWPADFGNYGHHRSHWRDCRRHGAQHHSPPVRGDLGNPPPPHELA